MDILGERSYRVFGRRVAGTFVVILLLAALLMGRLFYLQALRYNHYSTLSTQNRISMVPLPPARGFILDRKGRVLAENRASYTLEVVPERVQDLPRTLRELGQAIPISAESLSDFYRDIKRKRPFEAVILRQRLNAEEVAAFAVRRHQFPGVEVNARLHRYYPNAAVASHLLGYVGRINSKDLTRIDPDQYAGLDYIGKDGVEQAYETELRGKAGYKQVEINSHGRVVRDLERLPAIPGKNMTLTIDLDLQQIAEAALAGRPGAVVALNPANGEVLALVSQPGFDPNWFVNGIDQVRWAMLRDDPDHPMNNRFLRGVFPPGSTLKPFVALAALNTDVIDDTHTSVSCHGFFQLPGSSHRYHCWRRSGHGSKDVLGAIAQSCDVFFYTVTRAMGIERFYQNLSYFGFGQPSGIDLQGEKRGVLPNPAWKRKRYKQPWYPGETIIAGIGQGYNLSTPLQLARATAVVANGGLLVQPHIGKRLWDPLTGKQQTLAFPKPVKTPFQASDLALVQQGMALVVSGGTATNINGGPVPIAGKTGTAQVATIRRDASGRAQNSSLRALKDHALFIAYAPVQAPKIAVAVIVEHGEHGNTAAAPVAKAVIERYLADEAVSSKTLERILTSLHPATPTASSVSAAGGRE